MSEDGKGNHTINGVQVTPPDYILREGMFDARFLAQTFEPTIPGTVA